MPKKPLPQRLPIHDLTHGAVSRYADSFLLSSSVPPRTESVLTGDILVRYGIPLLYESQLSVVPDLVVLDYGDMLAGETAWEFLMMSSHLYPRSDLLGYRNDGVDAMIPLKQLDFDSPYDVLVYRLPFDNKPLARLSALIANESECYPDRLLRHLPRYDNLAHWQEHG